MTIFYKFIQSFSLAGFLALSLWHGYTFAVGNIKSQESPAMILEELHINPGQQCCSAPSPLPQPIKPGNMK
ncbi:hypothetical protein RGU70_13945 [Herbaspirillum sp. RTI4]|uniref:hypothetical protein n=1 Tax=Herbaspirillum sp. RTI4 TaxID=3048640 RepID=UPI002AB523F0|nr:hypothetical protein [Herbaspirillum sp. RTI4]MDY7579416.1 hypothetical protein [Herbaspirillum sp. RTI4]MEA9980330.1 hypothetical protein [Herbaspirillum sp. RTI4]